MKVYHFSFSQHFVVVKLSLIQAVITIYFNNKKVDNKSLICQIMIVNKVPNFPSIFSKHFAENFRQCIKEYSF